MSIRYLRYISLAFTLLLALCQTARSAQEKEEDDDDRVIDELRIGVLQHDVHSDFGHRFEEGKDINAEVLFVSPDLTVFNYLLSPRPHLGMHLNTKGATHQFYFGLTWHFDIFGIPFIEGSFGGSANTARINSKSSSKRALGARVMFRESVSIGVNIGKHHTLSAILDHTSNASLANRNPGLTNFGGRYGYKI